MPKAIYFITWDNEIGSKIESKYPFDIQISDDQIIKYLSIIQILVINPSFIIKEDENIILIHGIPSGKETYDHSIIFDFIILILSISEEGQLEKYKVDLTRLGKILTLTEKVNQKKRFDDFILKFFIPNIQKIVFIGFPNAGKTTTKRFLFDHINEEHLISTYISPTQGFESFQYKFIDCNVSLFDTSGQELERWYHEKDDLFNSTDLVIFFFSIEHWISDSNLVKEKIQKIRDLFPINTIQENKIIIFCHKIDLLTKDQIEIKKTIIESISFMKIPIFFTSIKNGGNEDLILGTQIILSKFSGLFQYLQLLFLNNIDMKQVTPLYLMDNSSNFIAELNPGNDSDLNTNTIKKISQEINAHTVMPKYTPLKFLLQFSPNNWIIGLNLHKITAEISYIILKSTNLNDANSFFEKFEEFQQTINDNWKIL